METAEFDDDLLTWEPSVPDESTGNQTGKPVFALLDPQETGVAFQHFNDERLDRMFDAESNGSGIGWIDYDLDGLPDLYVPTGCRLPYQPDNREHVNALYRNRDGRHFEEVAGLAGVADNRYSIGMGVGDFDNDGFADLYVCNVGDAKLYQNQGDGTFRDRTVAAGVGKWGWNSGAAFGDVDRDGDLDLYVSVYAEYDLEKIPVCYDSATMSFRAYCGPGLYAPTRHHFFVNQGAGVFVDATVQAGCDVITGRGMGVAIADFDDDRWPEIFVANDLSPSYLFHNLNRDLGKPPRFEEIGAEAGVAFDGAGNLVAGMGVACGDGNGDGLLDLCVAHFAGQSTTYYRNDGRLTFTDVSARVGLVAPTLASLSFGAELIDVDNDGWLDLYHANGHVLGPKYAGAKMNPQLFRNVGDGIFDEISTSAGDYFHGKYLGRGAASCDFDNDGRIDLVVSHTDVPVALLGNVVEDPGQWLALEALGRRSNRDGVNVRVRVQAGERVLLREIVGGGSYQSAPDRRLLIGLSEADRPDRVEVVWPSGRQDVWTDLAAGVAYLLVEGRMPVAMSGRIHRP